MENITHYSLSKRIGYAKRNNWFVSKRILGVMMPCIPTDQDIHVHNSWKDLKKTKFPLGAHRAETDKTK